MGLLDTIANGSRRDPEYHYRHGEELCRNGYYLDAIDALDAMLAKNPHHAGSWFLKGYALYQSGRYDEAMQSLDRALEHSPTLHEAHTYKGLISSATGRHREALAFYDRALALDQDSVKTWYAQGLTLAILDQYEDAIRSYEHALALEPGHIDALTGISIALKRRERGRPGARPIPATQDAGGFDTPGPVVPEPGRSCMAAHPPRVLRLPDQNHDHGPLPQYPGADDGPDPVTPAPAVPSFRSLLFPHKEQGTIPIPPNGKTTAPMDFWNHEAPARRPLQKDPVPRHSIYDEEIARLQGSVAADPHDAEAWCLLGDQYIRTGRYRQATEAYERALDCNEESAEGWARLGDAHRKTGAYDEALFAYERSLEIAPEPAVWISHARVLMTTGSSDRAIESCDQAIALDASSTDAWLYKGFILRKVSRHDEAITAYDRVLALCPGHDQAIRQRKSLIDGE